MSSDSAPSESDTEDGLQLDTKSRILQAALTVFAARGYDAATIREITQIVGLSHGLIRYHFENKETLWKAAIRFTFTRARRVMSLTEVETADLSAREQLELELRRLVTYYARHPEHLRIVMQEVLANTDRLQWIVENFTGPLVSEAVERTRQHMDAGLLCDADPINHYYAVSAASRMIFIMAPEIQRIFGMDPFTPEAIERHVQTIITLVMGEAH